MPFVFFVLLLFCCACGASEAVQEEVESPDSTLTSALVSPPPAPSPSSLAPAPPPDYDTTQWLELIHLDSSILLDIRYATDNNFVGEQMYDCGRCWLRPKVARAVVRAHQNLQERGYGLKMYDCYRPGPFQQRLWDKVPDPRYVANPARGSVHSRGAAVDLTVVDLASGEELDMGTDFDFFGEDAYTTTTDLPAEVLINRQILQDALLAEGFLTIRTEWWHFNFSGPRYELSEDVWPCPN
ncbi:MAG: M15 family metallopeptidase [Bacteroidota bacterium]